MGDDGVGIHIVNELRRNIFPDFVDIIDGGTAGLGLLEILSDYRRVIIIDAIRDKKGYFSGIRLLCPDDIDEGSGVVPYSMHDVELGSCLSLMKRLRMNIPLISILGVSAKHISPTMELSAECKSYIPEAVRLTKKMI
jgi:hydrogenase maturation protease